MEWNDTSFYSMERSWLFHSTAIPWSGVEWNGGTFIPRTSLPTESLEDFFEKTLAEGSLDAETRCLVMELAETWSAFIGDSWKKQSLKWFWLEECLDGGDKIRYT